MFTGIVADIFKVNKIYRTDTGLKISIKTDRFFSKAIEIGASVSFDGVCLTVIEKTVQDQNDVFLYFDVIGETLDKTNLSELKVGKSVNLERSLKLGSEIGGHLLTGHISTKAAIYEIKKLHSEHIVYFCLDRKWHQYLINKTHIAIDGISLTLVKIIPPNDNSQKIIFTSHLIPETLKRTTLGIKKEGDSVNIEFNQMIKVIVETTKRIIEKKI